MQLGLKFTQSNREIKNLIIDALLSEVDIRMRDVIGRIRYRIQTKVAEAIKSSPEYKSLVDQAGQLRGAFGVVNSMEAMNDAIEVWSKDIHINLTPATNIGGSIKAGFSIGIISGDYSEVLGLQLSSFITQKDDLIPWMQWLLTAGTSQVVDDYVVSYGKSRASRTGLAVMKKSKASGFSVPGEFAGTEEDNFVTRSLDKITPEIIDLIITNMEN